MLPTLHQWFPSPPQEQWSFCWPWIRWAFDPQKCAVTHKGVRHYMPLGGSWELHWSQDHWRSLRSGNASRSVARCSSFLPSSAWCQLPRHSSPAPVGCTVSHFQLKWVIGDIAGSKRGRLPWRYCTVLGSQTLPMPVTCSGSTQTLGQWHKTWWMIQLDARVTNRSSQKRSR